MPLLFPNLLKGRVAESVLITLLERAGYRVTRLGVEELFDEIKLLSAQEYRRLNLPQQLRTIPDLLVAEPEITAAYLVEVKFRRYFDQEVAEKLHAALRHQRRSWPESYAVVMLAEPAVEGGRFHQDYLRVIPPGQEDALVSARETWPDADESDRMQWCWGRLPQLQTVFKKFYQSDDNQEEGFQNQQRADFITRTLAHLAAL